MLDQRINLPFVGLRGPGIWANATLSATFEVAGLIELSAKPIHSILIATLPSRNSSSVLKMSMTAGLDHRAACTSQRQIVIERLDGLWRVHDASAWPLGALVSSQMSPPCCQMKPLICMS